MHPFSSSSACGRFACRRPRQPHDKSTAPIPSSLSRSTCGHRYATTFLPSLSGGHKSLEPAVQPRHGCYHAYLTIFSLSFFALLRLLAVGMLPTGAVPVHQARNPAGTPPSADHLQSSWCAAGLTLHSPGPAGPLSGGPCTDPAWTARLAEATQRSPAGTALPQAAAAREQSVNSNQRGQTTLCMSQRVYAMQTLVVRRSIYRARLACPLGESHSALASRNCSPYGGGCRWFTPREG